MALGVACVDDWAGACEVAGEDVASERLVRDGGGVAVTATVAGLVDGAAAEAEESVEAELGPEVLVAVGVGVGTRAAVPVGVLVAVGVFVDVLDGMAVSVSVGV